MFEQISIPGLDSKPLQPKPEFRPKMKSDYTDRLFFAVLPDADAVKTIRRHTMRLREQHTLWGRPIIDGRLHVSLWNLGDYRGMPVSRVKAAWHAANLVLLPSFNVNFDQALTFARKDADPERQKPCVLIDSTRNRQLAGLQSSLVASLRKFGFAVSQPPGFTPHVTVLYDKKHLPTTALEPVSWKVREFVLVRSQIGDIRRPYDIVGRWSLLDDDQHERGRGRTYR